MPDDDLDRAFREGRLTRRAYVRQRLDTGMDMQGALAAADAIVPSTSASVAPPADPAPLPRLSDDDRPRHADHLDIDLVGDGYLVSQPDRGRMHSLNSSAAVVFELCTGANDLNEIARSLQRAYELDDVPTVEVRDCLAVLHREGLIR